MPACSGPVVVFIALLAFSFGGLVALAALRGDQQTTSQFRTSGAGARLLPALLEQVLDLFSPLSLIFLDPSCRSDASEDRIAQTPVRQAHNGQRQLDTEKYDRLFAVRGANATALQGAIRAVWGYEQGSYAPSSNFSVESTKVQYFF